MNWKTHKKQLLKKAAFRQALKDTELEFIVAKMLVEARNNKGLSQQELAEKLGTTQSVISRLERGKSLPSLRSLQKMADSLDYRLKISFV